ncbi:MAG: helix-turn-helix domain-containing protein [Lachnospiraceae bacterium]
MNVKPFTTSDAETITVYPVRINGKQGPTIVMFTDQQEAIRYADKTAHASVLPPSQIWETDIMKQSMISDGKNNGKTGEKNSTKANDADNHLPAEPEATSDVTPFAAFLSGNNLTMKKASALFGIPYRTVQNWKSGVNKCPDYVLAMMKKILGNET